MNMTFMCESKQQLLYLKNGSTVDNPSIYRIMQSIRTTKCPNNDTFFGSYAPLQVSEAST